MIHVHVRLFATLRRYQPAGTGSDGARFTLSVDEGTSVRDLITIHLNIPAATVKMMFVNGLTRDEDWTLHDGDEIGIFPPIAGG